MISLTTGMLCGAFLLKILGMMLPKVFFGIGVGWPRAFGGVAAGNESLWKGTYAILLTFYCLHKGSFKRQTPLIRAILFHGFESKTTLSTSGTSSDKRSSFRRCAVDKRMHVSLPQQLEHPVACILGAPVTLDEAEFIGMTPPIGLLPYQG